MVRTHAGGEVGGYFVATPADGGADDRHDAAVISRCKRVERRGHNAAEDTTPTRMDCGNTGARIDQNDRHAVRDHHSQRQINLGRHQRVDPGDRVRMVSRPPTGVCRGHDGNVATVHLLHEHGTVQAGANG